MRCDLERLLAQEEQRRRDVEMDKAHKQQARANRYGGTNHAQRVGIPGGA